MKMGQHKKLMSVILCIAMCLTLFGGNIALAQGKEDEPVQEIACSEGCILESGHEGDCVMAVDDDTESVSEQDAGAEEVIEETEKTEPANDATESERLPMLSREAVPMAEPSSTVATIGEDSYASLKSAFENVKTGETIILQENITGLTTDGIATLAAGKKATFDMNGKSITVAPDFAGRPIVNEGELTVVGNGVIDASASESDGLGAINNKGTLTIENGTYRGAKYASGSAIRNTGSGAVLTIENGTFDGATCAVFNEGTVTINNGTFTGTTCSQCNGDIWSYTIRNYTTDCKMTINGGTFTGVQGAVSASVGYLEINGGTFKTVKCVSDPSHTATFYALYAAGEVGKVKCVINDGHFETEGQYTAVLIGNDNDGGIHEEATGIINGGTFAAPEGVPALKGAEKTGDPQINGGTFSSDVSKYVSDDAGKMIEDKDGNYVVKEYVAETGGEKYIYLQDAIDAANGGTVTLVADTTESVEIPAGVEVTLDLGEFTLTNEAGKHTITNRGTLTISGNGTVDNISHARGALVNYGTATMVGGTLTRSAEAGSSPTESGGNSWYVVDNNGGTMTVKGGTIVNTSGFSSLIRNLNATFNMEDGVLQNKFIALKNDDNGVIDMTGGTITTTGAGGSAVQNWGEFTMSGGELNAPDDAKAIYALAWDDQYKKPTAVIRDGAVVNGDILVEVDTANSDGIARPDLVIEGGDINGDIEVGTDGDVVVDGGSVSGSVTSTNEGGTLKVSGGEFAVMPNSEYIDPNMTAVEYTAQDGSKVSYIGTAEEVVQKLASAGAGDTVEIVQGDVALTLPEGVTVENKGEGEVVVNGETVEPGKTIIVAEVKTVYYKDAATGVILNTDTTKVPDGSYLLVKPVAETEQAHADAKEALKDKAGRFVLYDITLVNAAGEPIQPAGDVLIGIPTPDGYDTSKLAVHRINEDKTTVEHGVTVQDGVSYFQTDHFSKYALIEKGSMSGAGTDDTAKDEGADSSDTPKTGDRADMTPYILLAVMAGAAAAAAVTVTMRKRRQYEK